MRREWISVTSAALAGRILMLVIRLLGFERSGVERFFFNDNKAKKTYNSRLDSSAPRGFGYLAGFK